MESLLVQDYLTLRVAPNATIVQTASKWIDLGDIEDLTLFTDVKDALNSGQLAFDTAATPLDAAFVPLVAPFTLTTGLQTNIVLASFAATPPARYLRWRLIGNALGSVAQATFRVWASAYRWA